MKISLMVAAAFLATLPACAQQAPPNYQAIAAEQTLGEVSHAFVSLRAALLAEQQRAAALDAELKSAQARIAELEAKPKAATPPAN